MGMYDTLVVFDENDDRFRSKTGVYVRDYQTKSLDNGMETFVLVNGRLHEVSRNSLPERIEHGHLVRRSPLVERKDTCYVVAYTAVHEVDPVLTKASYKNLWSGSLVEREPWFEIRLHFVEGVLRGVEKLQDQDRDDLRRELSAAADQVLADDDPAAVEHFRTRVKKSSEGAS